MEMVKLARRMGVVSLLVCFAILMMSYHARSETERKEVTMVEKTPDHTGINWEIVRSSIVRTLFHQQLKREDQDNDALAPSTDVAPSATNRTLPSAVLVYNR